MPSVEELLAELQEILAKGEKDGTVHFNPPGPHALENLRDTTLTAPEPPTPKHKIN